MKTKIMLYLLIISAFFIKSKSINSNSLLGDTTLQLTCNENKTNAYGVQPSSNIESSIEISNNKTNIDQLSSSNNSSDNVHQVIDSNLTNASIQDLSASNGVNDNEQKPVKPERDIIKLISKKVLSLKPNTLDKPSISSV